MSRTSHQAESDGRRTYGRKSAGRTHHGRHKRRFPVVLIILILIVLAAGAAIGGEVLKRILPSHEEADLQELYGADDGYASVLLNHGWIEDRALWQGEHPYMTYEAIRDDLNGRFFWDSQNQLLLYTLPEETISVDTSEEFDGVPVILIQDGEVYISLYYAAQYLDMEMEVCQDPLHLVICTQWGDEEVAEVTKDAAVRVKGGIKSPVITTVPSGDQVTVLEQMDNWSKVQTGDGWVGFIQNKYLGDVQTTTLEHDSVIPEYSHCLVDYDVCLVWEQSLNNSAITQLQSLLAIDDAKKCVTTVSPTWFSLTDADGGYTSHASSEYVSLAHENGMDVWPVLENVNNTDVDVTSLLASTTSRNALVDNVITEVVNTGADGLNLDLENIPEEAADGYLQLIRELSVACRKNGLVFSVDDPVPSAWASYYDWEEQGRVADYVVLMSYDEHYSGSEAGSTASLPYVQQAVADTLDMVPKEQIINGVPFYTRLWKETPTLDSEAIGMDGAAEFVAKYNGEAVWDDSVGQNYVKIQDGNNTYQIWLEDCDSMKARLDMLSGYDIAGIACWKQGMENSDIWGTIAEYYAK